MSKILDLQYLGNSVTDYLYAVLIFALTFTALYLLRGIVFHRLKIFALKTKTDLDDFFVNLLSKIKAPEYQLISLYVAIHNLKTNPLFSKILTYTVLIVVTYRVTDIAIHIMTYWFNKLLNKKGMDDSSSLTLVTSLEIVLKVILWSTALAFVLSNMGINVSAVITGLGIGGIAIALASQNILGDLFNFFVILLDKPFNIGDFIISDDTLGCIEHIGLKSTKIRSLSGELIVLSNTKLLSAKISNYNSMEKRRVVFKVGVIYQTTLDQLKKIPGMIKTIIEKTDDVIFDRGNLSEFANSSIDFEFVYYIQSGDYNVHMKQKEAIFLNIVEQFKKEGLEFAYPTQTLFI
ncbi:MAG: mechanosensitive ion channel family protein, partial [Elusimicrobia bacterium]|nr:mechanosensitive ion channel family protein [Elusimicrobiota bacterium]